MEHSMRATVLLVFTLTCLLIAGGVSEASTIDLSNLPGIEKKLVELTFPDQDKEAVRKQIKLITNTLKATPTAKRSTALRALADETGWGTLERAVTYYVCAWYGVNYERCRDYLLNCCFWHARRHHRKSQQSPFAWMEYTPELLYALYEHNKDSKLLCDLITGRMDGCGGCVLQGIRARASAGYPARVLEVARRSEEGLRSVAEIIVYDLGDDKNSRAYKNLMACIRKAVQNPQDPLNQTAREILRRAEEMKKRS